MSYEIVKNTSMKTMMILRHYNEIHVKIINSYSFTFIPNNIFDNYLEVYHQRHLRCFFEYVITTFSYTYNCRSALVP